MEFSAKKSDLLKELDLAQGVVEKKATIPILSNILLEAEEGMVRLSATDLELGVNSTCIAKVKKTGAATVPARRLVDIVRSLPDAEVRIKMLENNWVQLTCERSSFKLVGMARDNFPALPPVPEALASVPGTALATLIRRTAFAVSGEESRYTLSGALLLLKPDTAAMVATDGHRLALVERDVKVEGVSNELRLLVPRKAMSELEKMLSEAKEGSGDETVVKISKDESHLFFSVGGRTLISRLLTGQFPNYEAVLPKETPRLAELDREAFTSAIRRVALLADERSHAIRLQLDKGRLELFSTSGEYGEAHETLDVDYDGEAMEIGFNHQYLLDFLGVLGEGGKVRLELQDEQSAGQLRPLGDDPYRYRYVVMPMRI
ncbi:MAG TPA: DNA polymerase III subunit beta [Terriglobia bacterium]|nr:DNA polymerase III subunit beta [Terriglobia bacterium]